MEDIEAALSFDEAQACASRRNRATACGSRATMLRQKLERDETVEASILGLVNHSHPASTELLDDAVMRDGLTDHDWRDAFRNAC